MGERDDIEDYGTNESIKRLEEKLREYQYMVKKARFNEEEQFALGGLYATKWAIKLLKGELNGIPKVR